MKIINRFRFYWWAFFTIFFGLDTLRTFLNQYVYVWTNIILIVIFLGFILLPLFYPNNIGIKFIDKEKQE
ncbi:hypothetical protein Q763_17130 [Flavobacterium beibuense F44-8]|uniref:Uncharacterized protein n=1 Tax=Flavobacterium beibuense F44-8 TaxID=1406840 RepID=A0A0A2LF37_9FLAO|nr:hypothetical protein Q763_17130 [Flavobacterium beibuense F44-8]